MSAILKSDFFRTVFMPALLLVTSPLIVIGLWQINVFYDGSEVAWALDLPSSLVGRLPMPTVRAAGVLLAFTAFQFALLVLLPGESFYATISPQGNRPWYKLNGVSSYVVSHLLIGAAHFADIFSVGWIYTHMGEFLASSCVLSLAFCVFLYFKGIYFPSSSDAGRTGHGFVWDFWWGTELHPTVFGYCIKQLINCRVGMTGWQMLCWSAVAYQHEVYGYVAYGLLTSVLLQFVYLGKFFWWEDGYFNSMDIQHDRFGYYICWGILNWVPGLYPYAAMTMARVPDTYTATQAAVLFAAGCFAIYANYDADRQRQIARRSPNAKIWGKPAKLIHAKYTSGDGKKHTSTLLYSGWWGVTRHFHYIAELASCICWTLPVGFSNAAGWVYVIFLVILLFDRAYRDELRCAKKYGRYWREYCQKVPYRVIPYIY